MKTKFSPLLSLRQRELDEFEANLAVARQEGARLNLELADIDTQILAQQLPKSGNSQTILILMNQNEILRNQKAIISEKILLNQKKINHCELKYQNAFKELEKVKYLNNEEIKKEIKKQKKLEEKMLDEIAVQRFFRQKENL